MGSIAVTNESVKRASSGLSSDSEVSFVIAGFEDPSGNPMSSSNTAYVDRTSDSSRIRMDVTDPHVIDLDRAISWQLIASQTVQG